MEHPESVTCCSLAACGRLKSCSFSLQFNNSNSGLFTVNAGMKNISQVHMIESWNGLKKVSVWQQTFNRGAMPDLKQGELKALGAFVYGSGLKTSFYRTSSAATSVLASCQEAAMWQGACQEALNSSPHGFHLDFLAVLLELVASNG